MGHLLSVKVGMMAMVFKVAGNSSRARGGRYHTVLVDEPKNPWSPWWAWRPVRDIHGAWRWLRWVYRKPTAAYRWHDQWPYDYGTEFDYLQWRL